MRAFTLSISSGKSEETGQSKARGLDTFARRLFTKQGITKSSDFIENAKARTMTFTDDVQPASGERMQELRSGLAGNQPDERMTMTDPSHTEQAAQPGLREAFEKWLLDVHMLTSEWNEQRNCFDDFPAHLAPQWGQHDMTVDPDTPVLPLAAVPQSEAVARVQVYEGESTWHISDRVILPAGDYRLYAIPPSSDGRAPKEQK
jgi:hypothetical protein